jgi:hypothetical protein
MLVNVLAKSGEAAKSGPIGLAVILILCILCYFLFKSMSKHLRKVREEFPGQQSSTETRPPGPAKVTKAISPPAEPPSGQPTEDRPGE